MHIYNIFNKKSENTKTTKDILDKKTSATGRPIAAIPYYSFYKLKNKI